MTRLFRALVALFCLLAAPAIAQNRTGQQTIADLSKLQVTAPRVADGASVAQTLAARFTDVQAWIVAPWIPQSTPFCMDGATCSATLRFDGTSLVASKPISGDVGPATVTATGSTTARALKDRSGEVANVRDYGAVCNWTEPSGAGATDDTAAFQAAIDSGKPAYVPPGKCYVAGTLYLPVTTTGSYLSIKIFGDNMRMEANGARGTTHIHTSTASLFKPKIASTYSSISKVSLQMSGLSIQSSTGNTILFDSISFTGSRITNCLFQNFKNILYGSMWGVSSFDHNVVLGSTDSAFKRVSQTDFDPAITSPLVDSTIEDNYINSQFSVALPNFAALYVPGANSSTIARNYIDYAYIGIEAGNGAGLVTIADNTFDILYRAIQLDYGTLTTSIVGNRFFRMRNASKSYFTTPTAAMSANDWTCIWLDQKAKGVTIQGNVYRDVDRFLDFTSGGKWFKDLRGWGNVGGKSQDGTGSDLTGAAVRLTGRTVDEVGFNGQGEIGDGTGFRFESMEMQTRTSFPHPITESYEGNSFFHTGVLVTNRSQQFYDANGGQTWGRTNLAPAADFSAGWATPGTGMTVAGGIATFDGTNGNWHYGDTLGAALQPGTYAVILHVATRTSGYVIVGVKLNDASNMLPSEVTTLSDVPGTYFRTLVVPTGKTGTNLALYGGGGTPFIGTLDTYKIIRLTSP